MHVQVVLFEGFDLLDAIGPYEVFTAAAVGTPHAITVELVGGVEAGPVRSGLGGVELHATAVVDPGRPGLVVVPGAAGPLDGSGDDTAPAIVARCAQSSLAEKMATALTAPDVTVATVCGGSMILALAGLIEDRPAVTNSLGMDLLEATGVRPVHARIVDDGDLVTAAGVTSGIDLGLYLLDRFCGADTAIWVERLFEHEQRGTVWHHRQPEAARP